MDDLINGQPSRCARPMMHVNLEGILACLITCCSEIACVSCTDIYISILTSVITVCALFPPHAETNIEVGFAFFWLKPKDEGTKLHSSYATLINTLNVINQQHGGNGWVVGRCCDWQANLNERRFSCKYGFADISWSMLSTGKKIDPSMGLCFTGVASGLTGIL